VALGQWRWDSGVGTDLLPFQARIGSDAAMYSKVELCSWPRDG
jgi:hypothetical protein